MKALLTKIRITVLLMVAPFFLLAQSNQYLHFDKVDDFVNLPNASQYIANSSSGFSMAGWFNCDALGYGQGVMSFRSGTQGFYLIQLNNGELECRFQNSAGTLFEVKGAANTIVPQMWQHIAWVYDGSTVALYMNGVLKGSKAASGTITSSTIAFTIGKCILASFNFVFGGRADEVSVWNKGLTQAEIQDMMQNGLTGTESNLQLYYKFDQGVPGGDNTSITKLISEVGSPAKDADLMNFALIGNTSNFGGTLNPGYQAISFPQLDPKLITDGPFTISATATSGLPVSFDIVSGPATINGNTITLSGTEGEVKVRATQGGNGTYTPATPVINTFFVYDPATHLPEIDARNPLPGDVRIPSLKMLQLAAISTITVPELFQVQECHFLIDGVTIPAVNHGNNHFTGWWTPPAYGSYTISFVSSNNYGHAKTENISISVIADTVDQDIIAAQGILLNTDVSSITVDAQLPAFVGAFDKITATLQVSCPPGGCGIWDRVASVDAKGHDGQWFEIIRYITPYGTPCSHNTDLTDYMSLLSGKISFRFNCMTLDNGYTYKLTLHYGAGYPVHPYSQIYEIWNEIYPFGDMANLQPVEPVDFNFPENTAASRLKLISTGHGWDFMYNTSNAAEFYEATHHIWVNNAETFAQHNWSICNPNPDGCSPQNGTWYHPRAGWCPGSIAPWFNYDMNTFITTDDIELGYVFYPDYVDLCHPNNPNCVSPSATCTDCNDGFNPSLDVACNLVVFADQPIAQGIKGNHSLSSQLLVYPNPSTGLINISTDSPDSFRTAVVRILTPSGTVIESMKWDGQNTSLDLSSKPKGLYFLQVQSASGVGIKKFMLL
ncbi:MAG: LamG-like jellyroll fold domain-containing protein [Bacteroidales bacterium]